MKLTNLALLMTLTLMSVNGALAQITTPPVATPPVASCIADGTALATATDVCCGTSKADVTTKICTADESIDDERLVYCTPGQGPACTDSKGCFKLTMEHMFVSPNNEEVDEAKIIAEQNTIEQYWSTRPDAEPAYPGGGCSKNMDCDSYSCVAKSGAYQCADYKNICRLAALDEVAPTGVNCELGLVKNAMGICSVPLPEIENYPGLLDPEKNVKMDESLCKFVLDDETAAKARIAIETTRAFEYIMANIDTGGDDCMKINTYLKEKVGTEFLTARQKILKEFNLKIAEVEKDQKTMVLAQTKSEAPVSMHGEAYTEGQIADRKALGYDMLRLMHRRNIIFGIYERDMNVITTKVFDKIDKLNANIVSKIDGWGNHKDKQWTIDGTLHKGSDSKCRGFFPNFEFGRKKVWKRWTNKIWLSSNANNLKAMSRVDVLDHLSLILEKDPKTEEEVKNQRAAILQTFARPQMAGRKLYLIDLLLPTAKSSFASAIAPTMFDLMLGGITTVFPFRREVLRMSNLELTRQVMKEEIKGYYKKLKEDPNQKDFIYEPELLKVMAKNCIEAPNAAGSGCDDFDKFLEKTADIALAQVVAYSLHNRGDYKNYFHVDSTPRRQLLKHWKIQLANVTGYYIKMATYRQQQNACIEKVVDKIVKDHSQDGLTGIGEGKNYFQSQEVAAGAAAAPNKTKGLSLKPLTGAATNTVLGTNSLSINENNYKSDALTKNSNANSGSFNKASLNTSALASRIKNLQAANLKAAALGVNMAEKEESFNRVLASVAPKGGMASASSGAGGNSSDAGGGTPTASTGLDAAEIKTGTNQPVASGRSGQGLASGQGLGSVGQYGQQGSSAVSSNQDHTGMSDEEKDVVMANLNRNKSRYEVSEDDGIFKIVSKAYIKNLDKILTRKKASAE